MSTETAAEKLGTIVGGTRYGDPKTREVRFCLDLLDLDAGQATPARIPLTFLAHGFAALPTRVREAALFEKRGPGGAYVDLIDKAVLRPIAPTPGHHFYGHGAYSAAGDALFAVETSLATNDGLISVRDPNTFDVVDQFPSYGVAPHDCSLIEGGNTLVVTNGGGRVGTDAMPCVTFVDVASRKLLERVPVSDPMINTGHVATWGGRELIVVSAPRDGLPQDEALGGVSVRLRGRPMLRAREPSTLTKRMKGESLSLCVHEPSRTALATHPYGHFISFWNLDSGALFAAFDLPNPRGATLTLDGKRFAVSFGPLASLMLIEASPLRPMKERPYGERQFGGSHIYTWTA